MTVSGIFEKVLILNFHKDSKSVTQGFWFYEESGDLLLAVTRDHYVFTCEREDDTLDKVLAQDVRVGTTLSRKTEGGAIEKVRISKIVSKSVRSDETVDINTRSNTIVIAGSSIQASCEAKGNHFKCLLPLADIVAMVNPEVNMWAYHLFKQ